MEKKVAAETERLILRRYKKEDIQDLFEYLSDQEVVKYEPYNQVYYKHFRCYKEGWMAYLPALPF